MKMKSVIRQIYGGDLYLSERAFADVFKVGAQMILEILVVGKDD